MNTPKIARPSRTAPANFETGAACAAAAAPPDWLAPIHAKARSAATSTAI